MQCSIIKQNGERCEANSLRTSSLCFRHDPNTHSEALEASRMGGEHRLRYQKYGEEVSLKTTSDVKDFLNKVINEIWTGNAPLQLAGAMGFLCRIWTDIYEISALEDKVDDLSRRLEKANYEIELKNKGSGSYSQENRG